MSKTTEEKREGLGTETGPKFVSESVVTQDWKTSERTPVPSERSWCPR